MPTPTPSQTAGPFVSLGTEWLASGHLAEEGGPEAIVLAGRVFDGEGRPVTDAMLEFWRPGASPEAAAMTRALSGPDGSYRLTTAKPTSLTTANGGTNAPHIDILVFARGLLQMLVTRAYFEDETAANASDPVLVRVPSERRGTLMARRGRQGEVYEFDVHLQGEKETVFFATG